MVRPAWPQRGAFLWVHMAFCHLNPPLPSKTSLNSGVARTFLWIVCTLATTRVTRDAPDSLTVSCHINDWKVFAHDVGPPVTGCLFGASRPQPGQPTGGSRRNLPRNPSLIATVKYCRPKTPSPGLPNGSQINGVTTDGKSFKILKPTALAPVASLRTQNRRRCSLSRLLYGSSTKYESSRQENQQKQNRCYDDHQEHFRITEKLAGNHK